MMRAPVMGNGVRARSHAATTHTARSRRARYAVRTGLIGAAVTACCLFAIVLSDQFPLRFDVTATREHQLSARSTRILRGLRGSWEVVVAVNGAGIDPRAAQRTQDALAALERASSSLRINVIDAASANGARELDAVLGRVVARDAVLIDRYRRTLADAAHAGAAVGEQLENLGAALHGAVSTITATDASAQTLHRFLNDSAAFCRLSAKELADARTQAESQAKSTIGQTPVPGVDEASRILRSPLANVIEQLRTIGASLGDLAASDAAAVPVELRTRARQIGESLPGLRDRAARLQAALDDLPRVPSALAARTLERSSAAIVIGPEGAARGGLTSVDVSSLFPPKDVSEPGTPGPAAVDTRGRTEELIVSAITALSSADTPVVVLVHGEGARIAPDFGPLAKWAQRLRARGVDVVEWATAMDPEQPSLAALDPGGRRPVVYATISTSAGTREGAARMVKLAAAIRTLVDSGKAVLMSVNVSELPAIGQADPMVEPLKALGVDADSARPLLQEFSQPTGRVVSADMFITDPRADHAVAGAIRGLVLRMPWAIPVRTTATPGVTVWPIVQFENTGAAGAGAQAGAIWAESEWTSFRRVPVEQRSSIANPPAADSSRDDRAGPWTVVAAVERGLPGVGGTPRPDTQRLIVVGSNGWFLDEVAQAETMVYAQPVLYNPANVELFDAALAWLARQDDAIATGPQARTESLIPNLSEAVATTLRWGLIGGLPLVILLTGAVWRLVRG